MKTKAWEGEVLAGGIERIAGLGFKPDYFITIKQNDNTQKLIRSGTWSDSFVAVQNPNNTDVQVSLLFIGERDG